MSDIIVGSVGVRLVPNAEGFAEKTKALTRGLTADVRVNLDDKDARARLDTLGRPRDAKINATADTAKASAQLDAAAHDRKVNFEAKGLSAMVTGVAALGPALVPVAAAAAGLVATLGAPIAAGAGGLGLYGLIAGKAVSDTEKQSKAILQLKKQVDAAQTSLQKASTPAGKKSALATLATDTKAYNDALAKLSPAQAGFLRAQGQVVSAFHSLENTAGPAIFGPLTSAMTTLSELMPKVAPVLKPVSAALQGLLDEVAKSARSGALDDFMKFLAVTSGPTITTAGHILGNVALGFAAIGKAFAPLGSKLGDTLLNWSRGFAQIGQSKGLSDFVGYVRREGPQVASTLGHVAGAIGHIATALAPIGDLSLKGIDVLAKGVSKIPTGVLTVAAGAFASIALSMKAIGPAKAALSGLSKVGSLAGFGSKAGSAVGGESALSAVASKGVVPVYVTNEGFGPPGVAGAAGRSAGAAAGEAGAAGALGSGLGSVGILGGIGIGGFGLASSIAIKDRNRKADNGALAAAIAADKAAAATKRWKEQEAGLGDLLLGPALPTHLHNLQALPRDVQTKVETPGAIQSVSDIARLTKQYHLTPKQVRTLIEASGVDQAHSRVAELGHLYGLTPKQVRTLISQAGMDSSQAQIRRLATLYHLTPKQVHTIVTASTSGAAAAIARIRAMLAGIPRSISTAYYVNQINSVSKAPVTMSPGHGKYATGGYTGDRPAHEPVGVVHGREFVFDAASTAKAGVENLYALQRQLRGYATGGLVGGRPGWAGAGWGSAYTPPPWWQKFLHIAAGFAGGSAAGFHYSLADQSNIVQVQQQIRDLTKQLDAHKKDKNGKATDQLALTGLDRKAAELNLKLAQQQLRDAKNAPVKALRDALSGGFNVDQALGKQPTNPIAAAVRDSVSQFKQQVTDAGGVWTKHLQRLTAGMVRHAAAIDKDNRAIDRATTALGNQQQKLSDLTSQMDSLKSTMGQFSSSVGGNFLSNGFGLGGQSSTFQPTVDNTPALGAATDQLNAAKAHLAALSTGGGDINTRLANAYAAQGVASDVAKLQAQVDKLSQPVTTTTDSLQSLRDVLTGDTKNALAFNDALHTLASEGLNKDLFSQLAASGDTGLATELAAAGQSAVADINSLWTQRAAAAAQVAAYATQQVYGQQQAILQGQITQQNVLIGKTQASIDSLNAQVATLGQRVENGAAAGVKGLQAQIDAVAASVAAIPRQIKHASKR